LFCAIEPILLSYEDPDQAALACSIGGHRRLNADEPVDRDAEFWRFVTQYSEPSGPYPAARKQIKPGGVYIGVGPEQNFSYALALEAKMAFVVDIRRQNMLELLLTLPTWSTIWTTNNSRPSMPTSSRCRRIPRACSCVSSAEREA